MMRKKRYIAVLSAVILALSLCGCGNGTGSAGMNGGAGNEGSNVEGNENGDENGKTAEVGQKDDAISSDGTGGTIGSLIAEGKTIEELVAAMSLEQKVNQMLQPAVYNIDSRDMEENDYGSILSHAGFMDRSEKGWKKTVRNWQESALESDTGIPYVFGNDAVHGVNVCSDAVIFPHNIGIGAAHDPELTYQMGAAVAEEIKLTGMLWNFSPCVAVVTEPRWGRTYESYSSDSKIVEELGAAYTKGQVEHGVIACAKHYLADGNVGYGTGEGGNLIDRGDAKLTDAEIDSLLQVYKAQIDAGVQSIMVSHSSLNDEKMHGNRHMITDVLKGELGFKGVVVSDWESIHNIPGEPYEQVVTAVNAGIDMLMEPDSFAGTYSSIIEAVNVGDIEIERIDDAVTRILTMKKNANLFEDPYQDQVGSSYSSMGSDECREIARKLVEKSLVLLKNENDLLPIKQGSKLFVTGRAAEDTGVLCGGWTYEWQGGMGKKYCNGGTSILTGLQNLADDYNLTIITDPDQADEADLTILCLGEIPYSEWNGDTEDMSITGALGLPDNEDVILEAKAAGKPVVTLLVAGRNVIYDEYEDEWDSIVICYLPGSEGDGVANVLVGKQPVTGTLPMPYYSKVEDIEQQVFKYPVGYGLSYTE